MSFGYFLHMMFFHHLESRWLAIPNFGGEKRLSGDMINQYMGVEASFQVGNFQDAPRHCDKPQPKEAPECKTRPVDRAVELFSKRAFSPFWVVGGNPV